MEKLGFNAPETNFFLQFFCILQDKSGILTITDQLCCVAVVVFFLIFLTITATKIDINTVDNPKIQYSKYPAKSRDDRHTFSSSIDLVINKG